MTDKLAISNKRIIDCLDVNYGILVESLTVLTLGADMNASIYKATGRDQSGYFVKVKRSHQHDVSTIMLALLHDAGIHQIILPVKSKNNQSTQTLDDFTLTVFPFVEGQDGFCRDLKDDQWVTLGKVMKKVHEMDVPPAIQARLRREVFSPQWRKAVMSLLIRMETESSKEEAALLLIKFIKKHIATIHRLVDQAEQLCQKVKDLQCTYVLCHSDIHGGNILIDKNNAFYVVDWDESMMAPKERDLMFIGGGVANVWNQPREEKLFYEGYGKTDINMTLLAYYRHERILEDIALICQQLLFTTTGGQRRLESYQHFIAQFEPQGVVEIAFKTLEKI